MSDYSQAIENIQIARKMNGLPSCNAICDVLDMLVKNLDKEERCGCISNYIKGKCPYCECPVCHRKKE